MNKKITWIVRLLLLVIFSSLVVMAAHASIPGPRQPDGCILSSRLNTHTLPPPYLFWGRTQQYDICHCPTHIHSRSKWVTNLYLPYPFGRVVGHFERIERGGSYITVPTPAEIKYFPFHDVYVESTREWSFKDLRR